MSALTKVLAKLSGGLDDTRTHLSQALSILHSDPEGASRELRSARESLNQAQAAVRDLDGDA